MNIRQAHNIKFYTFGFFVGGSSDKGDTLKLGIYKIKAGKYNYTYF